MVKDQDNRYSVFCHEKNEKKLLFDEWAMWHALTVK
jgi:hypothetical protein